MFGYLVIVLAVAVGMYFTGKWAGMEWTLKTFSPLYDSEEEKSDKGK